MARYERSLNDDLEHEDLEATDRRRAVFREIGREILNGPYADRAQTISRAMEKAFRAGVEMARSDRDFDPTQRKTSKRVIELIDLPPRARDAFETIRAVCGLPFPGDSATVNDPEPIALARQKLTWNTKGWRIVHPDHWHNATFGLTTISPLERMGLLAPLPNSEERLTLTVKGLHLLQHGWVDETESQMPLWESKTRAPTPEAPNVEKPRAEKTPAEPKPAETLVEREFFSHVGIWLEGWAVPNSAHVEIRMKPGPSGYRVPGFPGPIHAQVTWKHHPTSGWEMRVDDPAELSSQEQLKAVREFTWTLHHKFWRVRPQYFEQNLSVETSKLLGRPRQSFIARTASFEIRVSPTRHVNMWNVERLPPPDADFASEPYFIAQVWDNEHFERVLVPYVHRIWPDSFSWREDYHVSSLAEAELVEFGERLFTVLKTEPDAALNLETVRQRLDATSPHRKSFVVPANIDDSARTSPLATAPLERKLYGGMKRAPLTAEQQEEYGVETVDALVDEINSLLEAEGRPRLPEGSFPENKGRLKAFLKLLDGARERAAAMKGHTF